MTEPLVSVIIVTWNGRNWLERCLPVLEAQTGSRFETIVVDNGSIDGTRDFLAARPAVRVIANRTNRGFAPANNQGIAVARGDYIATLNNDALAEPGWLAALVDALEAHPAAGAAASRMVQLDAPDRLDSAGLAPDRFGFGWNLGAGAPAPNDDPAREVFGACAGAALYRRRTLEAVGLFDEQFESYYEDVDLAWRIRLAGWGCRYVPGAVVRHAHSATGKRLPGRKRFLLGRNRLWTLLKNMPWPQLVPALAASVVLDGAAAAGGLARREPAALAGRLAALAAMPSMLRKRAIIQRDRVVSWQQLVPLLAPAYSLLKGASPPGALNQRTAS